MLTQKRVPSPAQRREAPLLSFCAGRSSRASPDEGVRDYVVPWANTYYVGTATLSSANSRSMVSLTFPSANSAATRTAFLIAFVFDEPWVMMLTPFTPNSGAPPYSV